MRRRACCRPFFQGLGGAVVGVTQGCALGFRILAFQAKVIVARVIWDTVCNQPDERSQ